MVYDLLDDFNERDDDTWHEMDIDRINHFSDYIRRHGLIIVFLKDTNFLQSIKPMPN